MRYAALGQGGPAVPEDQCAARQRACIWPRHNRPPARRCLTVGIGRWTRPCESSTPHETSPAGYCRGGRGPFAGVTRGWCSRLRTSWRKRRPRGRRPRRRPPDGRSRPRRATRRPRKTAGAHGRCDGSSAPDMAGWGRVPRLVMQVGQPRGRACVESMVVMRAEGTCHRSCPLDRSVWRACVPPANPLAARDLRHPVLPTQVCRVYAVRCPSPGPAPQR